MVSMIELSVLYRADVVMMLLGKDLLVMHRLNGGMVVVLVDLFVNSCVDVFVVCRFDCLMLDRRSDCAVNGCIVMARLGHEVGDGFLGFVHCDGVWVKSMFVKNELCGAANDISVQKSVQLNREYDLHLYSQNKQDQEAPESP